MRLICERAGVMVVDSLEELVDLSELLLRFPNPQTGGLGVLTGSGAICVLTQDYIEALGVEMPELSETTVAALRETLPPYLSPHNPLDVGTIIGWQPELLGKAAKQLLSDSGIGSLLVSLPMADPVMSIGWMQAYLSAYRGSAKPAIYVIHQEDRALAPELLTLVRENKVVVMRSHERALRALAQLAHFSVVWNQPSTTAPPLPFGNLPPSLAGNQPEWLGKATLAAMGIRVPRGSLARTPDEAATVATGIGYPVVLKAQAASLLHKSDAGGVLLNIKDESSLRSAWDQMQQNIKRFSPELVLDGVLVEAMGPQGLELVVGATRDPQWGPLLMVGLGGVWIEALGDFRLFPADAPKEAIARELHNLKAHKLLEGFRGSPPADVDAVVSVAQSVGRLMRAHPDVMEVDINPLVVYPEGQGAMALDALIVTRSEAR
jgi:acyl-CoA synthetase (NDP forming)